MLELLVRQELRHKVAYLEFLVGQISSDPVSSQARRPISGQPLVPTAVTALPTFAAVPGPSSFVICSFACFGRSTVFVRGRRPNKNDIFEVWFCQIQLLIQLFMVVAIAELLVCIRRDFRKGAGHRDRDEVG